MVGADNNEILDELKRIIEKNLGWGDSAKWTNQDFMNLSDEIFSKTNLSLSHTTLKRIWGKVEYNSLPNPYTLSTLSKFAGYENWRSFLARHDSKENTLEFKPHRHAVVLKNNRGVMWKTWVALLLCLFSATVFVLIAFDQDVGRSSDYKFSSKKVVTSGLPNTVVFNFDASKAPVDSVVIQQSWDRRMDVKVSKNEHVHTSIYYLPDYYKAKLLVNGKVMKQHELFIKSDGWLTAVLLSPKPVYINQERVIREGKMALPMEEIKAQNIPVLPQVPSVLYTNVQDFGPIYTDDFVFETVLKNDYQGGASACQQTNIYLLCEGTAVRVPLSSLRCVSDLEVSFTNFKASGKRNDLSAFGVDFTSFVKVKVVSKNGTAEIYLNDQLAYTVDKDIVKSKVIGINYYFDGTGSVDYVRLSNGSGNVMFENNF